MVFGCWGKKVGMTQLFNKDKVVPVTAVDLSGWFVVGTKNLEKDGYCALQVAKIKDRFKAESFNQDFLKDKNKYFSFVREIRVASLPEDLKVGASAQFAASFFEEGSLVDVTSKSKGCGFAGTVKRYNFKGGRASHGDKTGRKPGSLGFMTACGKVIKGKKMPGRMGGKQTTVKDLSLIQLNDDLLFVKGAIPGKAGSLIYIHKSNNK
jgi:large subunit ribosomal protein L3